MLAVLVYLRRNREGTGPVARWGWLAGVFLCYLLAVTSKAVAVSLPAVLLILDIYPLRRWGGRSGWMTKAALLAWIEKLPFFAVAVLVSLWAAAAKDYSESRVPFGAFDLNAQSAQSACGLVFYLAKTAIPTRLIPYYKLPEDLSLHTWRYGLSGLGVLAATLGLFVARRRRPAALATWAAYAVILLPNLGIVAISQQIATDRYSYLAMLPVMMMLAGLFLKWWRHGGSFQTTVRAVLIAAVFAAASALTLASRRQALIWHDSQGLWEATLDVDPGCAVAECNLGVALLEKEQYAPASQHLSRAIDLRPDFAFAYGNFGIVLCLADRFEDAVLSFERAIALGPDLAERDLAKIHAGLGTAYAALRQDDLAWRHTRKAQQLGFENVQRMIDYLRKFSEEPKAPGLAGG
jgi:tetratricopeptide (TPR) repeat protein